MIRKNFFIVAFFIDCILLIVFVVMLGLVVISFDSALESANEADDTATFFPTVTEMALPTETPSPVPTPMPIPTPTESPTLTPIPSPTPILPAEPTKPPYIFQTPVFIPPNMRDQPIRTPTRTRTR